MIELSTIERNIFEVLCADTLTVEQLAAKADYEVSGHLRRTVSSLSKRGIVGNKRPGYFVQPDYQRIINELSG